MKFMIEFHLKPGHKEQVLATFEQVGPNRNPGVAFRGAWIGARNDIIFVLVECEDESRITDIAQEWQVHGQATAHAVVDVEQL